MSNESPAVILFDTYGNPCGMYYDGVTYRLQVDSKITDGYGNTVSITNISGFNALNTNVLPAIVKTEYDLSDTSVIYIGTSPLGTATSASAWLIKKTNLDTNGNPTSTFWSSSTAIWDNRLSEIYS